MADFSDLAYALGGTGKKTNPYDARRKYAYSMLQSGMDTSPIQSPWQGASRLAQALVGGWQIGRADDEEKAADKKRSDALAQAMAEPDPQKRIGLIAAYDPDTGARAAGTLAVEQAKMKQQQDLLTAGANSFGGAYGAPQGTAQSPSMAPLPQGQIPPGGFANNAGNIRASAAPWEGKGAPQNGFETFATPQAGANAMFKNLGAYVQANPGMTVAQAIAKWAPPTENNTQAYVSRLAEATGINPGMPLAEVLKDPAVAATLMDGIARIEKGGLPQGFNADTFMTASGAPPQATGQPTQLAGPPMAGPSPVAQGDASGMPPAPNPAAVNGPAVIAPPSYSAPPRPQASPQQLGQYRQRILSGEFGMGPEAVSKARAALDADLDRQWAVDQKVGEKNYEQSIKQPQETIQNEARAREEFNNLQVTKDYRKADSVFRSAVNAANTNSAAADLNLVYAFATLMDPGSVVREGEMGMVRATQNAGDYVKSLVAAVSGGQRLSPETRHNLVDQMAVRYDAYKATHDEIANHIGGIAERSGMKRENVIVPLPPIKWEKRTNNQTGLGGKPTGPNTIYGPDGKPE